MTINRFSYVLQGGIGPQCYRMMIKLLLLVCIVEHRVTAGRLDDDPH